MVKIKLFGTLRLKTGFKETEADITSIKEAWSVLSEITDIPAREFKKCIVALNGKPCKASAKLSDGDEITLFSPSGGG
jgi:molybdopterin converting factor small subunit